jgi:hypothetical protein
MNGEGGTSLGRCSPDDSVIVHTSGASPLRGGDFGGPDSGRSYLREAQSKIWRDVLLVALSKKLGRIGGGEDHLLTHRVRRDGRLRRGGRSNRSMEKKETCSP